MTAKVLPASVSYGIGVQNRYSAFLDDEDAFGSPLNLASVKRVDNLAKQKQAQLLGNSLGAKSNGQLVAAKSSASRSKQDSSNQDQQKRLEGKRQQAGANNLVQSQKHHQAAVANNNNNHNNRHGNNNQDNTANNSNNRFARNQFNHHHQNQNNVSHHNHQQGNSSFNKENTDSGQQQQGKFNRNPYQRQPNRRFVDGEKRTAGNGLNPDEGFSMAPLGVQSSEEEKRRRQQKRALDLKHKDPEKRESRRNQNSEQSADPSQAAQAQDDNNAFGQLKNQRNRRQFGQDANRNPDDVNRGFRNNTAMRGRGRRDQVGAEGATEGDKRDGQQPPNQRPFRSDRPPRNRNGFGTGSRGSRGSRGDDSGKYGQQKPIPNFSDKLDFPSLAS